MPNNTRGEFKRSLSYAVGNLENAQDKIGKYIEIYGSHHPEISYTLTVIIQAIEEIKSLVNQLNESV